MKSSEYKTCYIMNFWLGDRRLMSSKYQEDRLHFVKKQIETLGTYKHKLNKIIFNFNIEKSHYHFLKEVYKIVPKSINGAHVEINIRENIGLSYGAWSELFIANREEFDYFIFNEDDYFFIEDNWDNYLIEKYESYDDCGYLCMVTQEPAKWNKFRKVCASSVGVASTENLTKVYNKYGKLPSIDYTNDDVGEYDLNHDVQFDFAFAFLEFGKNIYDVREDYKVLFRKGHEIQKNIDVWKFFNWNKKHLCVPEIYFERNYTYWESWDKEFKKEHNPTTVEQAVKCHKDKKSYLEI